MRDASPTCAPRCAGAEGTGLERGRTSPRSVWQSASIRLVFVSVRERANNGLTRVKIAELAEVLVRSRQSLWILRAASCGADTCPAPDVGTALRMIHAAVNGLLEVEGELRSRSSRSFTPIPRADLPTDRPSVERLAAKCLLEVEEMQRNVAFIVRDMSEALDGGAVGGEVGPRDRREAA